MPAPAPELQAERVEALAWRTSSSLVRVLSAEGEVRTLEQPRCEEERLVTRLDRLLLLEPEVRRLGVKRLMKSSMVFTGDFSSNRRTCDRERKIVISGGHVTAYAVFSLNRQKVVTVEYIISKLSFDRNLTL